MLKNDQDFILQWKYVDMSEFAIRVVSLIFLYLLFEEPLLVHVQKFSVITSLKLGTLFIFKAWVNTLSFERARC